MAKLFANLDKLKDSPRPTIILAKDTIAQGELPTIKTNFPNNISLANRLGESKLGTTAHLSEFFVTDMFTGQIKIRKTEPFQHTSNIVITKPSNTVTQGGTDVIVKVFKPSQGQTTVSNFVLDSLLRQGTTISNGAYNSLIVIKTPKAVGDINQGSTNIVLAIPTVDQGVGTNPIYAIGTKEVNIKQGLIYTGFSYVSGIFINDPPLDLITNPNTITYSFPNQDPNIVNQAKNVVLASLSDSNIEDKTPTLQTLAYAADRSLSIFAPRIKHGSESPTNKGITSKAQGSFKPSDDFDGSSEKYINLLSSETPNQETLKNLLLEKQPDIKYDIVQQDSKDRTENDTVVDNNPNIPITGILGSSAFKPGASDDDFKLAEKYFNSMADQGTEGAFSNFDGNVVGRVKFDLHRGSFTNTPANIGIRPTGSSTGSVADYKTVIYKDIRKYSDLVDQVKERIATRLENDTTFAPTALKSKEVIITFSRYDGGTVSFTAFLTSLNDTFNASFEDINYIGKQDTFKLYKGTTRQIGIGFRAAALGESELKYTKSGLTAKKLASKVNELIQITSVGTVGDEAYTVGPFVKFSITPNSLYSNLSVAISSLKIDVNTADNPWDSDLNVTLPTYYDISLDMTVLSTQDGTLFDSNKSYIG